MADSRAATLQHLIARRDALKRGIDYLTSPPTPDHQDDLTRWLHDLDAAIAALTPDTPPTPPTPPPPVVRTAPKKKR